MAITNQERVGKALDLLKEGLRPFVERELKSQHAQLWFEQAKAAISEGQANLFGTEAKPKWDTAILLSVMWNQWQQVFRKTLGQSERTLVSELRDVRNRWAHQESFSTDDAYRALDSAARLLTAVSATEAAEVEKLKMELLRVRFDEQARAEKRKTAGTAIESQVTGTLKPWREVVAPHKDVATGRYQQAEFAADLWQVHLGEGSDEYRKPPEFFRRTYLTESLSQLLTGAVRRLSGKGGGDPVVQLQTNFGGGKTHSMLALYHLFSGASSRELPGIDAVLAAAEATKLPEVRRVVLVGNKISPGNPVTKPDGTVIRTLWGELAWQLGHAAGGAKEAKKAFKRILADDENATSPGDALRELLNDYGPSLILIDEWVAYARQLHDQSDLPAGSFETQFSFAQALTESAKLAKHCLLVISLPASDSGGTSSQSDEAEVGGARGHAALIRLRNVIGRVESSWRPASAEEGFEIVRRRLFEPLVEQEHFVARDTVARAFYDMYRNQKPDFPPEAADADYETRLKSAYPIHPEVFDRLYSDWSTLAKFQRTRGVLRLMAAVIHSLWEKGDRNPLIMPGNIPIDDPRVQFELTRYLPDHWVPVIEKDIDGPSALPLKVDTEIPNLGKFAACRRVARTVYMGSAPTVGAAHHGLEDRQVKLGCVMPGEPAKVFGDDALRRLAAASTYLYQDGPRYWYSTQPTVTKLAEDRAEQLRRDEGKVATELERRLRIEFQRKENFSRIHVLPQGPQDVSDEMETRLVVLRPEEPHAKDGNSLAEKAAREILDSRGNAPRLFRNTLVFLAADQTRLQELDEAVRRYLAWESIVAESDTLNLAPQQAKQAESQKDNADKSVRARLPETYQWLLVPAQSTAQQPMKWEAYRLSGAESIAARASKKLRGDELLLTAMAGTRLRMELDRVPLWPENHVKIGQLADYFARYTYLPRLADPGVLYEAVRNGLGLLLWQQDTFAYADSYDETAGRYRGLRAGQHVEVSDRNTDGLLVKPDIAQRQLEAERQVQVPGSTPGAGPTDGPPPKGGSPETPPTSVKTLPRRYHASVVLDEARVGRDAARIAEEVLSHLTGLAGATVRVTLEIEAQVPGGVPEGTVRIVTENGRTLQFSSQGFEVE